MRTLTLPQARRVAISAQGLARTGAQQRPAGPPTIGHLTRVIDRIGVLQIDSVNVLARAHLLPLFSRLGPYDVGMLDRASRGTPARPRRVMESWAHVAAYVPSATYPLLQFRFDRFRAGHAARVRAAHPEVYDAAMSTIAERGPMTAAQMHAHLGHERGPKEHWGWNWSIAKQVMEAGFFVGDLAVARRSAQFERVYDLTERVLPPHLSLPGPAPEQGQLELMRIATRALGIGAVGCFADYFRLSTADAVRALSRLAADGELEQVAVAGWDRPLYMRTDITVPRRTDARALLAPFDPMVFERRRLLELFGMHYRIGIYTPKPQRTHGYYVLPFLLGEELAARVDLKADRSGARLLVRTAFGEGDAGDHARVAAALVQELQVCASWLGLTSIDVEDDAAGDLVRPLIDAL